MARPAPLRSPVKYKRLERKLDGAVECVPVEPGVQWLSGCPSRQEPRWRVNSVGGLEAHWPAGLL